MNAMIERIRRGEIDINNQELFFSILLKGLLLSLEDEISIRNISVPHFIVHTGSDALYLEHKGYDISKEPTQVTNESYIYSIVPRCVVTPGGIDLVPDQLSNPYTLGQAQYDSGENLYNLVEGGVIAASDARIHQGTLESSNVNVVDEMVNMIAIQRAYDAGQKVIRSVDETLATTVNLGKVQ